MELRETAWALKGLQTVKTASKKLGLNRQQTIRKIHQLRKEGFVKTSGGGKKNRVYDIDPTFQKSDPDMYDIINKYSKVKLNKPYKHFLHGKKLSVEEVIVKAIIEGRKRESFRLMIASLGLFNHVRNWPELYYYAKKNNAKRIVGAFYDAARTAIKVRRMDRRTRRNLLKDADNKIIKLMEGGRTGDFDSIEDEWKVIIPFNKGDLIRYKEF